MNSRIGFGIAASLGLLACGSSAEPDRAELSIQVLDVTDPNAPQPLAGALLSLEAKGIYVKNPDTSHGNPSFVFGGRAGSDGKFSIALPLESIGVHTFALGHYYGARLVKLDQDQTIRVNMEPYRDPKPKPPTIQNAALVPASVKPGDSFSVSADVAAGDAADPLSEEVLVIDPTGHASRALDPPSAGSQGNGFPDGKWTTTLTAPKQSGTFEYYLSAISEGCVTNDIGAPLTLVVQ